MRSYRIVLVVAIVALFSTLAGAQQRGPSTPEERARAVQTAKSLQSDPLQALPAFLHGPAMHLPSVKTLLQQSEQLLVTQALSLLVHATQVQESCAQ